MIEFPSVCLTLRPPWPQAIAYAGKRLENRGNGVASQIGSYRGLIGLSQSKTFDAGDCVDDTNSILRDRTLAFGSRKRFSEQLGAPGSVERIELCELRRNAGALWLVAKVMDVLPPERCAGDPWHVEGQHGIILGKVYEVAPVACMGGQGAWRPQWCRECKKIVSNSHGSWCKTCGLGLGCEMPELEVVRECKL